MKTVLKWNPYLDCELSAQEGWLEELSQEGLSIRLRLGSLTVCHRGDPHPGRRFRIEPARTWESASDPPAKELTDVYEEATTCSASPASVGSCFTPTTPAPRSPIPTRRPVLCLWLACGGGSAGGV